MQFIRLPYCLCLAALLALGGASVMTATLVSYTALPDWEGATSSYSLVDFEETASYVSYPTNSGYTYNGEVQFLGITSGVPSYPLTIVDAGAYPGFDHGSGDVLRGSVYQPNPPTPLLRVSIPSGVTSVGVDLMTYNALGPAVPQSYIVRIGATDYYVDTLAQPGRQFFGITSSDPISQVDFILNSGTANTYALIDNFRYGTAASGTETPEPGTYLLVGGGLVAAGLFRRRRKGAAGA